MREPPIVSMQNIHKHFGGVHALQGVDFDIFPHEVVGLVGDNGAGKSTLAKILCGVHAANEGEIYFKGKKAHIANPIDARKLGIEIIYQDLALVEQFTVTQNLFLGKELKKTLPAGMTILDDGKMYREAKETLKRLKISIPNVKKVVYYLSGGQRQAVAIGRAVYAESKISVLIMDEPTAALGVDQKKKVVDLIKHLKGEIGISVIVITHNMEDIFNVCDRIMVLRNGKVAGVRDKEKTTKAEIVSLIVGAETAPA